MFTLTNQSHSCTDLGHICKLAGGPGYRLLSSGRERRPAVAAARGLRGPLDLRLRSASDPRPQSASRSRHQAHRPILPHSVWKDRETPRSPQQSRIWDLQSEATAATITKRPAGSGTRKTHPQLSG